MNHEPQRTRPPLFSQIDVSPTGYPAAAPTGRQDLEQTRILREILAAQDRQNELLEEMVSQFSAAQKQRANELGQWKQANPHLARSCRMAAEALGKVQTEFLESLTAEVIGQLRELPGRRVHAQRVRRSLRTADGPSQRPAPGALSIERHAQPRRAPNTP